MLVLWLNKFETRKNFDDWWWFEKTASLFICSFFNACIRRKRLNQVKYIYCKPLNVHQRGLSKLVLWSLLSEASRRQRTITQGLFYCVDWTINELISISQEHAISYSTRFKSFSLQQAYISSFCSKIFECLLLGVKVAAPLLQYVYNEHCPVMRRVRGLRCTDVVRSTA